MTSIGERLKELREDRNETQDDLSRILAVDKSTISNYERESRVIPSDFLIKACRHFGVTSDYLLCMEDENYSIRKDSPEGEIVANYRKLRDGSRKARLHERSKTLCEEEAAAYELSESRRKK